MKIADILRAIADNLEHTSSDVTPSGNDKEPENLFVPPLQQKIELLKKAVGVENIYNDGGPQQQYANSVQEPENELDKIKRMAGVPIAAIQELSTDDIIDD